MGDIGKGWGGWGGGEEGGGEGGDVVRVPEWIAGAPSTSPSLPPPEPHRIGPVKKVV